MKKANQVNNVAFTSTTGAAHGSAVRSNQLRFGGESLALAPGLETIDQLPSNVFRTATFDTYDQNYGWVFNNNAALTGGVNPSSWSPSPLTSSTGQRRVHILVVVRITTECA